MAGIRITEKEIKEKVIIEVEAQIEESVKKNIKEYYSKEDHLIKSLITRVIEENKDLIIEKAVERTSKKISAMVLKTYKQDLRMQINKILTDTEAMDQSGEKEYE